MDHEFLDESVSFFVGHAVEPARVDAVNIQDRAAGMGMGQNRRMPAVHTIFILIRDQHVSIHGAAGTRRIPVQPREPGQPLPLVGQQGGKGGLHVGEQSAAAALGDLEGVQHCHGGRVGPRGGIRVPRGRPLDAKRIDDALETEPLQEGFRRLVR